jgi:hypothetical protein
VRTPITTTSLTDEMILRFGRSKRDGTINDAIGRHICTVALGLGSPTLKDHEIEEAKQRICAALNLRQER